MSNQAELDLIIHDLTTCQLGKGCHLHPLPRFSDNRVADRDLVGKIITGIINTPGHSRPEYQR